MSDTPPGPEYGQQPTDPHPGGQYPGSQYPGGGQYQYPGGPHQQVPGEPPLTEAWYGADLRQAITRFVQKAAHFQGYASRSEFWWVALALFVVNAVLNTISRAMNDGWADSTPGGVLFSIIVFVIDVLLIVPWLSLTWRRLHDAGFPGPFFFFVFIPVLGWIVLLILLAMPTNYSARQPIWDDRNPVPTINWKW